MKLVKAQVKNYRSIVDSGPFDVERSKTILVGPNEAGKTALLRALQQINPTRVRTTTTLLQDGSIPRKPTW